MGNTKVDCEENEGEEVIGRGLLEGRKTRGEDEEGKERKGNSKGE